MLDPAARKIEVAYFIAYEMARLSLDNMLTPISWSHLWINEGLSRLIALEALDKVFFLICCTDWLINQRGEILVNVAICSYRI